MRNFPDPEGKWRVSFGGGYLPRWAPDGRTLYFWRIAGNAANEQPDTLFAVRVDRQPRVTIGHPEVVLVVNTNFTGWDIHPDGEHFLVTVPYSAGGGTEAIASGDQPDRYLVVLNWFEELRQRMGRR